MARTIDQQLLDAFRERGITLGALRKLADLKCSEDSVSRKLRGTQVLFTREAEAMAKALRVRVTFGREAA